MVKAVEVELALEARQLAVAEVLRQHLLAERLRIVDFERAPVLRPRHDTRALVLQELVQPPGVGVGIEIGSELGLRDEDCLRVEVGKI